MSVPRVMASSQMCLQLQRRLLALGRRSVSITGGCVVVAALLAEAAPAAPMCGSGQVAVAGRCVAVEEATKRIDVIVREAMTKHDLKAVLAGVAIDGQPLSVMAWGNQ